MVELVRLLLVCSIVIHKSKPTKTAYQDEKYATDHGFAKTLEGAHTYPTSQVPSSPPGLQSLLAKISRRQPLTMSIIGGSNTAGGGVNYERQLYYNILAKWWNTEIYPIKGSKLTNHKMAIGGTGSDFFSFCFQNFLPSKQPDIVLVELAVNDYGYKYGDAAQPMEHLTRRLLSLPSKPLVMYVNFVDRGLYEGKITNTGCNNMEDLGFDDLAKHYGIPSVSWRDYVCPLTSTGSRQLLNPSTGMYNNDGSHVAYKAHSEVAEKLKEFLSSFLRTPGGYYDARPSVKRKSKTRRKKRLSASNDYSSTKSPVSSYTSSAYPSTTSPFHKHSSTSSFLSSTSPDRSVRSPTKSSLFEAIKSYLSKKVNTSRDSYKHEDVFSLPPPKFTSVYDDELASSMCISFLTPNWEVPLKYTLTFKVIQSKDFVFVSPKENKKSAVHLPFRTDSYGAWASKSKDGMLKMSFIIPHGSKKSVALIFRTKDNKATTSVWLDDDKESAITVDSNKCGHHMYQTRLQPLATEIDPGNHILNVESNGHGWFEVSGLIAGYPGYHDYEGYRPFDIKAKMWSEENYNKLRC